MQRSEEIALLQTLLGLKERDALFLDEQPATQPVSAYTRPERFERERNELLPAEPRLLAHASELDGPDCFLRSDLGGRPLLLLRGSDNRARVFLNVCRHRGTRLVDEPSGCRARFACPYHAWTWNSRGQFVGAPHFEAGFPGLDASHLGLTALPCVERYGFIWLMPAGRPDDLDTYLHGVGADLDWLGLDTLRVVSAEQAVWRANWKLVVEGGLESYHFRVAHRATIAPLFQDTLSSYKCFGPHFRSVLPRAALPDLKDKPTSQWRIRQCANLVYTLFPTSSLLVQSDHVAWIRHEPLAADRTRIRVTTLVPRDSARPEAYWQKNHDLTNQTLREDFDLAERIQVGLDSGANTVLHFGRYEGALAHFNRHINTRLDT